MSRGSRYNENFKRQVVEQVTKEGYKVTEVAKCLGIAQQTLSNRVKASESHGAKPSEPVDQAALLAENKALRKKLKRLEQERAILKEAAVFFANEPKNDTDS